MRLELDAERADPGPRGLRRLVGHGRTHGCLGRGRLPVDDRGEARHSPLGARAEPAVSRRLSRPSASCRRARWHMRTTAAAGDRHPRHRIDTEGASDPLFAGLPPSFKALQWHSVAVAQPPGRRGCSRELTRLPLSGDARRCASLGHPIPCRAGGHDHPRLGCGAGVRRALARTHGARRPRSHGGGGRAPHEPVQGDAKILYRNFMQLARG